MLSPLSKCPLRRKVFVLIIALYFQVKYATPALVITETVSKKRTLNEDTNALVRKDGPGFVVIYVSKNQRTRKCFRFRFCFYRFCIRLKRTYRIVVATSNHCALWQCIGTFMVSYFARAMSLSNICLQSSVINRFVISDFCYLGSCLTKQIINSFCCKPPSYYRLAVFVPSTLPSQWHSTFYPQKYFNPILHWKNFEVEGMSINSKLILEVINWFRNFERNSER